jgi:diguanylate cyclase (GGDEF)-like protein/PAS domain S-box-containing protein
MSATMAGRQSIRRKLFRLIVVNGSFTLLVVGLLLFGYEKLETRAAAKRELASVAGIVADSSSASLTFLDDRAATDTLNALRDNENILQAAIYDSSGRLFASYRRESLPPGRLPAGPGQSGARFENGDLLLAQPIVGDGPPIGTVFLRASMKEADARVLRYMAIVIVVLFVSLGLTMLLSRGMQRGITQPIADLSDIAKAVSIGKDYSARARKMADDELGFLVDSFNEMLTQIENRDQALRESQERYALAARGSNDGLWDWNLATNEIYFSPRWSQMLGYQETQTWSDPEDWLQRIHPSDRDRVRTEIAGHSNKNREFSAEYRIRQRGGAFVWVLTRGIAVCDAEGTPFRMAGSHTDITHGKVADPLTGLPNRLFFLDRLESTLEGTKTRDSNFAVLFLDLDRFKAVNDSMGHAAGDLLLEGVSARLRESVRSACAAGMAGELSFVARLGGDEFAILLCRIEGASAATQFAQDVQRDLNRAFDIHGRQVFVGVSIGVALSSSGETAEELLRNADTAMYRAKTSGKARFAIFTEGMREQAVARLEIETELRRAIDEDQLVLHYQPQVSLVTGRLTGFEALVRWNHPERGMIPPCEFIPVAEETDLIVPLGAWVLNEACRQMAEWQTRSSSHPPLTIAVNVSYKQLTVAGFVESVSEVLGETGLAGASLRLEMTESAVMKDPEESIETLRRLKRLGVGLEIDDFGTGYSSLSYLSCLPFDILKIDRSFVTGLGTGEDRGEIVRSILELARSLGLEVIAEGVETEGELQRLLALGCVRAQGYYFSKPVDPKAVPAMVAVENLKSAFRQLEGRTEKPGGEMLKLAASAAKLRDLEFDSREHFWKEGAAAEAETLAHSS